MDSEVSVEAGQKSRGRLSPPIDMTEMKETNPLTGQHERLLDGNLDRSRSAEAINRLGVG